MRTTLPLYLNHTMGSYSQASMADQDMNALSIVEASKREVE